MKETIAEKYGKPIIVENPLKEFCADLKAVLDKHGIKSITPLCCIDCGKGEWHHIKIGDDGWLSLCGMSIVTKDGEGE